MELLLQHCLVKYFKKINHSFEVYIPDRRSEGYGPTKKGFAALIDRGVKLIFTVDCGTMAFEAIDFAQKRNRCFGFRSSSIRIYFTKSLFDS